MIIIDLIRELMIQQDLTIGDLARKTELSYTTIENVVLRDITPTPEEARIMLWAMGIKLEDVLCIY